METQKCFFENPQKTPCNSLYGKKKCDAGIHEKEACESYTNTVKHTTKLTKNLDIVPISQLVKESLELALKTK